jgi:hypothetical protein
MHAFTNCNQITHVKLSKLESVNECGFFLCAKLFRFVAPLLELIGSESFCECNALNTFIAPNLI